MIAFALAFFILFLVFAKTGVGAGAIKIALVTTLWLPTELIIETVVLTLVTGFIFGVMATKKMKIGELYLKDYAGMICLISAFVVFNNGILQFIPT